MTPTRVGALVLFLAGASCITRDTVATFVEGGQAASAVFEHGLCGCGTLDFSPNLFIDGFDSRVAPWAADAGMGDFAGNSNLIFPGLLTVTGDVTVAGSVAVGTGLGTGLVVGRDLFIQGTLGRGSSEVRVGASASIGDDVFVSRLDVGGVLTMPATASAGGVITAASRRTSEVSVPLPCRCDADAGVDVAALVEMHRLSNDNAAIGLDPTAFTNLGADTPLKLPCGVFFIDGVTGQGPLTLHATGRAAAFVKGSDTPLAVLLDPGAELDLFVDGRLSLAPGAFGDPARPRALRVYSTAGTIDLSHVAFSALLYAPSANLTSSTASEVFGALAVGTITGGWGGRLAVHYDRAATSPKEACQ